jgi:DNA polymerase V
MDQLIAVIDLKSFYASCECACRHLDIFKTPLVCCDPYRSSSSVVMSATPYLKKKYGIPNVCRRRDLPYVPGMIYAVPRMSYYLQMSAKVVSIFLDYVAEEDLHVYSVDESFLNLAPYLNLYHCSAEELVARIQKSIKDKLGLLATAGIGPNMFLAKIALDNEGKKHEPYIAHWDYEDVPTKLWSISPITKIWGIAGGTASHLARIGIRSLYELAHASDELLEKEFGIMGGQLKSLANGRDESNIEVKYTPKNVSLSLGQTLRRPYYPEEALLILREMCDDLSNRLRSAGFLCQKVSVWASYGDRGAFGKQMALPISTDDTETLYQSLKEVFSYGQELPIRGLSINFGSLTSPEKEQVSLFLDDNLRQERKALDHSLDAIRNRYGKNSVLRCSSLLSSSTIRTRHEQIGGHKQ